jgi:EAL domain-containing protein (putative c-di-GMP-specific phosphodiesterase class I)
LRLAVNLSAVQLRQRDLVQAVSRILDATRLPPGLLELEITESTAMQAVPEGAGALEDLRNLGVRIALDDFGVGYSSIALLRDLPIQTLKIDRSLVDGITRKPNNAAISKAIIAMAASLGIEVVAEGIETEGQLAFFVAERCDRFQGFLLARPMPAASLTDLLGQGPATGARAAAAMRAERGAA